MSTLDQLFSNNLSNNTLFQNQTLFQKPISAVFALIYEYYYAMKVANLSKENAMTIAKYSGLLTLITKLINDTIFQQFLVTFGQGMYFVNKSVFDYLSAPILFAFFNWIVHQTQFKQKIAFYSPSFKNMWVKNVLLYMAANASENIVITYLIR